MAQNLDLRCGLAPAPWMLGPKHVSNPEKKMRTPSCNAMVASVNYIILNTLYCRPSTMMHFLLSAPAHGCGQSTTHYLTWVVLPMFRMG